MKAYAWRGGSARLVALSGIVVVRGRPLKGAEVEALDSISGWAAMTSENGEFVLPDVLWYPSAQHHLLVTANDYQRRRLQVTAPEIYPENGMASVGKLRFDQGRRTEGEAIPGKNSVTYIEYDRNNAGYYKSLFQRLSENKQTDDERLLAASRYVASRLLTRDGYAESPRHLDDESPRQILENGSRYCGKLSLALATIAIAGNYKARLVNVIDRMLQPSAHMVTEVYYGEQWHLYDPTSGDGPHNQAGTCVVSYKELFQTRDRLSLAPVPDHLPKIHGSGCDWLYMAYASGFHHYYCFR
ncbi:MAG TPA: carboxypeptidase-like regulatory domain-containing protein [Blastocatellia bacterium]